MSSIQLPGPTSGPPVPAVPSRSAVKRRKIRKGTFSCWECKNRKTRCEFKPPSRTSCVSCQRRGLPCISQEYPHTGESGYEEVGKRIDHVEALVSQLAGQSGTSETPCDFARSSQGESTSSSNTSQKNAPSGTPGTTLFRSAEHGHGRRRPSWPLQAASRELLTSSCSLSQYLHSILPHPSSAMLILSRGKFFNLPCHMLWRPLDTPIFTSTGPEQLARISKLPPLTAHPILFARRLIQFALCLRQLDTASSEQPQLHLNEPVRDAARRYVEVASRHVTSKDLLMDSPDGLETLMLESSYHVSLGNVRAGWLSLRRALGIAQLIDLPRLAEKEGRRMEFMWFRLIYSDRFLSLQLGLPCAISDNSFADECLLAVSTPSERLERIQVAMVGRIIARNLRMQHRRRHGKESEDGVYDDFKETQDIDYELKQAARSFPPRWWMLPTLHNVVAHGEAMERRARILAQMHQYYLLVLLYQPYIIQGVHPLSTTGTSESLRQPIDYTYSNLAAHSAGREMLSRFLTVRNFHNTPTHRGLDYKAFTASTTLLLNHLHGHQLSRANVLEHQRPSDLGIIHDVIDRVMDISRPHKDGLSRSSEQILDKLMEIEADAANGADYLMWIEDGDVGSENYQVTKENQGLNFFIPYFGTLCIVSQGLKRPQVTASEPDTAHMPLETSITTELQDCPYSEDSPLTSAYLPSNSGNVTPGLQLQPPVPGSSAIDFDAHPTLLSSVSPRVVDFSQASRQTLQEVPLLNGTVNPQDCHYQVDEEFFSSLG